MPIEEHSCLPSLQWRAASTVTITTIGLICKTFLKTIYSANVHGLNGFLKLLEERSNVEGRKRGLITVSNHLSVVDDPLIWGFLPLRYFTPGNMRWSMGSYDICFEHGHETIQSLFFTLGQTLPIHRYDWSAHGGPFQPTITQCVRLLSDNPITTPTPAHPSWPQLAAKPGSELSISPSSSTFFYLEDPFSNPTADHHHHHYPHHTFSTTGSDIYLAPASYSGRRHAWVHVFPEGRTHQDPQHGMRYFKWGVARLILEAEPCPDVVPIFIEGAADYMPEDRPKPRWWPRRGVWGGRMFGSRMDVTFGDRISEEVFEAFRERWRRLKDNAGCVGDALTEELMVGEEAVKLRMEVARKVREEVQKLRRLRGWPEEDPKNALAETWKMDKPDMAGLQEGKTRP